MCPGVPSGGANHRPTIASLTFDGADWTATPSDDAGETGCIGMGFPEIPAEYPGVPDEDQPRYPIVATALDGDREVFIDELDQSEQVEDLFLRFFITAGKLDATYDAIDDGDPLAEHEHNYLELYGIPPSLGVVLAEWRALPEIEQCLSEAGYEGSKLDVGVGTIAYDKSKASKRLRRIKDSAEKRKAPAS